MSKIKEWEYDDAMHDYIKHTEELEQLLEEDNPDSKEITKLEKIIANFEKVLFS